MELCCSNRSTTSSSLKLDFPMQGLTHSNMHTFPLISLCVSVRVTKLLTEGRKWHKNKIAKEPETYRCYWQKEGAALHEINWNTARVTLSSKFVHRNSLEKTQLPKIHICRCSKQLWFLSYILPWLWSLCLQLGFILSW